MIVENRLTPLDRAAAATALVTAYQRLVGRLPSEKVAALLLAQSALETGHWKSIHNYNFGNIKAGPSYPLIVQFRCSELDGHGVETFYEPPDPHCNFRAYDTAAEGAVDYLKVLQSRPHWWRGLHTEDASAFVDALATPPKYFTANPTKYKRALASLYEGFRPLARSELHANLSKLVLVAGSDSGSSSSSSRAESSSERSSDHDGADVAADKREASGSFRIERPADLGVKPAPDRRIAAELKPQLSALARLISLLRRWFARWSVFGGSRP